MARLIRRVTFSVVLLAIVTILSVTIVPIALAAPPRQALPEIDLSKYLTLMLLIGTMAYLIEAVVELVAGMWLADMENDKLKGKVLKLLSSAVGLVFTISYGLDLIAVLVAAYAQVLNISPAYPAVASWAGTTLTGVAIGRGSQWFHDAGQSRLGLDSS